MRRWVLGTRGRDGRKEERGLRIVAVAGQDCASKSWVGIRITEPPMNRLSITNTLNPSKPEEKQQTEPRFSIQFDSPRELGAVIRLHTRRRGPAWTL